MDLGSESVLFDFSPAEIGAQVAVDDLVSLLKASFGGDRSEAGRYAANIRWQGNRKGDGQVPLSKQIEDVANQLNGLKSFPTQGWAGESYGESLGQYFFIRTKGTLFSVVGQPVMDAEKSVNALGVRVLTDAGARTVQSGFCTQQELDDAIAYQSRPSEKDAKTALSKSLMDRAVDKDPKVYPLVKDAVDEYERLKNEAKVARGVLIKATKEYNKILDEDVSYSDRARQARQVRREMQEASSMARYELRKAEQVLNARLSDLSYEDDAPLSFVRRENWEAKSGFRSENHQRYLDIHEKVGEEIKKIIGEHRVMAKKYPVTVDTSGAPQSAIEIIAGLQGKDLSNEKQQKTIAEVASRFPARLLEKLANITVVQKKGSGGSYSQTEKRILTDLDDADTFTHETVHALTDYHPSMRLIEQAALTRRTWGKSGDMTTPMDEKIKQGRQKKIGPTQAQVLGSRGQYIPDDFADPYQGRIYNDHFTETLTVATENLFGGGRTLRVTGRADRDMMATALGALLTAEKEND